MTNYELIENVTKGPLFSAHIYAPFDKGKKLLESRGYRIPFLEENAELRIQEDHKSFVSQNGNWVLEDAIYVPNKGVFITKNSPIMDNGELATEASRKGDFYLTDEQVEKSLEGAVELTDESIPTNRFGEFEITRYAFGETAEDYGKFLSEYGIKEMPIWIANIQDKPFARKLWFRRLCGYGSGLDCNYRFLFNDISVHGVKLSAKGAEKILGDETQMKSYTPVQISNALNELNFSGLENLILQKLRNQ